MMHVPDTPADSLSNSIHNQGYPQACLTAANDYLAFNVFRRNDIYRMVLENVDEAMGAKYLDEIAKDPEIAAAMDAFRDNDIWGAPLV